jgi:hypothetical protein
MDYNSKILELASDLAHNQLIKDYRDIYTEEELQSEKEPEIYKDEVQDSFNDLYDYFFDKISETFKEGSLKSRILEYIEKEDKEIKEFVYNRGVSYKEDDTLTEEDKFDLLSIDMNKGIVLQFNNDDMESHNFDLGLGRAYQNIKNIM